jgi:cysteine desulfurase
VKPPPPIYLDAHATTAVDPRVLEAMLPFFTVEFANADSLHRPGRAARAAVEDARTQIANLLHVSPRELTCTSGATEANNLALKGVLFASPPGSHLVVNAAEHSSVLDVAQRLRRRGYEVTILPVDAEGRVSPDAVAAAITDETVLVSVMLANNEIGTINDLQAIGDICREEHVLLHTDAVAALGRIPVDLSELPVDLATFSAHKIYGPKGIGALFLRKGEARIRIEPQLDGGGHEQRLRSGTLAVPLIVGFGAACGLISAELSEVASHLDTLAHRLRERLAEKRTGLRFNGPASGRLPGNVNVSFEGVDGPALLTALERDLAVSSGAACSSANPEPSHVLRAIGLSDSLCRASLRFGLSRANTLAEMDAAAEVVIREVDRLRGGTFPTCR